MTKTKISDLGSSVCVDDQNEKMIPALGNGAAIPGELCAVDPANGRVIGTKVAGNGNEVFSGILMESKITGTETAIVTDIPCKLVVPKSGHGYRIRCNVVAAADDPVGTGVTFSATDGKAETTDTTLLLSFIGQLALEAVINDTVAEVNWK